MLSLRREALGTKIQEQLSGLQKHCCYARVFAQCHPAHTVQIRYVGHRVAELWPSVPYVSKSQATQLSGIVLGISVCHQQYQY